MDKDFENRKKLDLDNMSELNRNESKTTLKVEAMEMSSEEDTNLEDPELYFGEQGVNKFWDFYKSERKFKDFTEDRKDILDPRQAYFQTCDDLMVYPRAKLIIRDNTSPIIEYSNVLLLDKSS